MNVLFSLVTRMASPPFVEDQIDLADGLVFGIGIRTRSLFPASVFLSERNAIHLPSGDHLGSESWPDCVS